MNRHSFRKRSIASQYCATAIVVVPALAFLATYAWSFDEPVAKAKPSPKLTPQEVIQLQISALSAYGDIKNRVARCYEFASPANKRFTGPIGEFEQMIQSPEYRVLLDARKFLVGRDVAESPGLVHLLLTVIDGQGNLVCFRCFLSKQTDPQYRDCWMTDAVIRVAEIKPGDRERAPAQRDDRAI